MRLTHALALMLSAASASLAQDVGQGRAYYVQFCAACHGPDARGDGPMSPVLSILPPDLTGLSARNDGVFPVSDVVLKIDGRDMLLAHGGPMPLFGEVFTGTGASMASETGQPIVTSFAIVDLVTYLARIQEDAS